MQRREMLRNAVLGAAGMSFFSSTAILAATEDPYLRFVHPDLRAAAAMMLKMFEADPGLSTASLAAVREGAQKRMRPFREDVKIERKLVPGLAGQPDVAVYVVNGESGLARPAILNMHGGGYVTGSADGDVADLQELCAELGCMAVSVEYRLAPETTYAGSIEDNYAALKWLYDNAASLGGDPARIAVMGGSAGGGHAALLAITARDRGEVPLAFQCLTYPMLDDRTGTTRPVPDHVGRIIWDAAKNRFGWASFLGLEPGGGNVPAAAVPARVENLSGLPPAFIGVGTIDLFHDEDVDYAQRLNGEGVPTELIVVPGAFHGFDGIGRMVPGGVAVSQWFVNARTAALRRGLGIAQ